MWTIMEKEFLDNLLNQRFLVGVLVSVLLTIGCIILQSGDYSKRLEEYRLAVTSHEQFLDEFKSSEFYMMSPVALLPPEPLSPLANGLQPVSSSFDDNYIEKIYPVLDLVFIVSVIMSLMAVLFSHDSICGERERGTLKLIHSNPVPRPKLILAKWLGGSFSVLLPLVVSCLSGMIYISLSPRMQLGTAEWIDVLLILLASITFISVFYLLGLMVSSLSHSSSTAVMISVLAWAVFVFVIPNLGPYIASRIEPVKSANERLHKFSDGENKKYQQEIEKQLEVITRRYELEYGQMFQEYRTWSYEEQMARSGVESPVSLVRSMGLKYRKEIRDTRSELQKKRSEENSRLSEKMVLEVERQTRLARNFSAISPFANYVFLATDLAGTGMESRRYDGRLVSAFYSVFMEYLQKLDQTFRNSIVNGIVDWDNVTLDLSGRPKFEYKRQPIADRVKAVLPFGAVLLIFNVLFFAGAYVAFLRYDVR